MKNIESKFLEVVTPFSAIMSFFSILFDVRGAFMGFNESLNDTIGKIGVFPNLNEVLPKLRVFSVCGVQAIKPMLRPEFDCRINATRM